MASILCVTVLICFVSKSYQQFATYRATGMIDVYSPFTATEPIFTSNAYRYGYRMYQSPLAINSQLDETYRLAAIYWFLQRMYAANNRPNVAVSVPSKSRVSAASPSKAEQASSAPEDTQTDGPPPGNAAQKSDGDAANASQGKPDGDAANASQEKPDGDAATALQEKADGNAQEKPDGDAANASQENPDGDAAPKKEENSTTDGGGEADAS